MDDVIIGKVETIEKCLRRIKEEKSSDWRENYTHQDALILNLERACQATIDLAAYIVKQEKLGIPKYSREVFDLISAHNIIDESLSDSLKSMVGFRNIAVHDYSSLNLNVLASILEKDLETFTSFSKAAIAYMKGI